MLLVDELIKYISSLGISVNTMTKARGHMGFFMDGRIDISKNTPIDRVIPTLLHEFAHYIHSKLETNIPKTGGTLKVIFNSNDDFLDELLAVTNFVDENSKCEKLFRHREMVKNEIKKLDTLIKQGFPKFQRSKPFKEFNRAIKGTNLKYLLKFDKVRIMPWFLFGKEEILSIASLEQDYPNLRKEFVNYFKLKSLMRKQKRITNRISKRQKYYKRPTELFARLVEGLYLDKDYIYKIAPNVTKRFFYLLEQGYYFELKNIFEKLVITSY